MDALEEFGNVVMLNGFEEALVGFCRRPTQPIIAVYDGEKIANILQERDGMTAEEAIEYISYNILGLWLGEETPAVYFQVDWETSEVAGDS